MPVGRILAKWVEDHLIELHNHDKPQHCHNFLGYHLQETPFSFPIVSLLEIHPLKNSNSGICVAVAPTQHQPI